MMRFETIVLVLLMATAVNVRGQDVCKIDDIETLIFGLTHEWVYALGLEWIHDPNGSPDMFRANIGDYPVVGTLQFENDVLVGCEYVFDIEAGQGNTFSTSYFQIKSLLSEQYGQPDDRVEYLTGKNRESSPQSENADRTISYGRGYYRSQWRFDDEPRTMTLRLAGKDGSLELVYRHFRSSRTVQQDYLFP
jgi:hypothetical protein